MATKFEQGVQITFHPLGHAKVTVSSTAVGLPGLPDVNRLRRAVIRIVNAPVTWRDDGTEPTSTTGFPTLEDEIFVYDSDFESLRFIRSAADDAEIRVAYYGL